jgi:hypothetical protein
VVGLDGRSVRLEGSLVFRNGETMIEVVEDSIVEAPNVSVVQAPRASEELGTVTLVGEIVDSKCYLGVMNPGSTKPHRACAVRCIAGGIPPLLVVRGDAGTTTTMLLVSQEGRAVNQDVLDMIAEPVELTGRLVRDGDRLVLWADPSTYKRRR